MGMLDSDELRWTLVTSGSAILAAVVVRQVMQRGWQVWKGKEPPLNPDAPDVEWKEAVAWAGVTGAAVALGRVIARRGAAEGWKKFTGRHPPIRRQG